MTFRSATIVFAGRLQPRSFAAFVHHRAARLSLVAEIETLGPGLAAIAVQGEHDLIDAFEMACSLGPVDCLVLETFRQATPAEAAQ